MPKKTLIKRRYRVNPMIFNQILKDYESTLTKTDNIENWIKENQFMGYNGTVRNCVYDEDHNSMIIRLMDVYYYGNLKPDIYYCKPCIIFSDDGVSLTEKVRYIPYAKESKKYITEILKKDYTEEEINKELKDHSVTEHYLPKHDLLPYHYSLNTIHKFSDCYYYDINNAHLDALTEIFSKSAKRLKAIRTKINEFKKTGDTANAQLLKDYVNFYVGDLGRKYISKDKNISYAESRGTWEWIVKRTREKLEGFIKQADGMLLYSNTDGFIVRKPKNILKTSKELGDIKQENTDTTMYALVYRDPNREYTPYWVYQYYEKGKLITKGNIANEVRDKLNLPNGEYVVYKKNKINNHFEYEDIQVLKGDEKIWL